MENTENPLAAALAAATDTKLNGQELYEMLCSFGNTGTLNPQLPNSTETETKLATNLNTEKE